MDISLREITKKYQVKTVLDGVSIDFCSGKIHGLLGENGAGKSTLAKIITGFSAPDAGTVSINGKEVHFSKPGDALKRGLAMVNQRPLLAASLSAEENILLSIGRKNPFFLPLTTPEKLLELKQKWAPNLNLKSKVKDLGGNNRFYVSLLAALMRRPDFLILDEPSAFLDQEERKSLYVLLREYTWTGAGIMVITHSTAEAKSYCDTISVLNEGKLTGRYENPSEYKPMTFDWNRGSQGDKASASGERKTCIVLKGVSSRPKDRPALLNADIEADYGEITAVSGMKEAALGTLEDFITGMDCSYARGKVVFYGSDSRTREINMPRKKMSASFLRKNGTAIVPSDKTFRASNPELTVKEMLGIHSGGKTVDEDVKLMIERAGVNIRPDEKCSSLSGGMLQRLILEREFSMGNPGRTEPKLIILCNPMHGLDIAAQSSLASRIERLASEGKAVLIIGSADFPMTLCSRVYSIEGGKTVLTFEKKRS